MKISVSSRATVVLREQYDNFTVNRKMTKCTSVVPTSLLECSVFLHYHSLDWTFLLQNGSFLALIAQCAFSPKIWTICSDFQIEFDESFLRFFSLTLVLVDSILPLDV